MQGLRLEVVLERDVVSALQVWRVIFDTLGVRLSKSVVQAYQHSMALKDVEAWLIKSKKPHFDLAIEGLSFRFSTIGNSKIDVLIIEDCTCEPGAYFEGLMAQFSQQPGFIQAWLADLDYSFWQNAKDPLQYRSKGRFCSDLPMKSNGLPPPLEQLEVDTSNNLGRRELKVGYIEAIGSLMWFGPGFWQVSGASMASLQQAFPSQFEMLENEVLKLQVADKPFTEQSEAALQQKLRAALFSADF